jgi:TRAP-type C4-dicarboxylate transport system permease small subunit
MSKFEQTIGKLVRNLAQASMWAVFIIGFIIFADVVLRRISTKLAILGTYELTELFMIVIVFLAFGITEFDGENIQVDMVVVKLPWRLRRTIEGCMTAISAVLCAFLCYAGILQTGTLFKSGQFTAVLFIPKWPVGVIMAVGLGFLTIVLAMHTVQYFMQAFKNEKPENELTSDEMEAQRYIEETKDV